MISNVKAEQDHSEEMPDDASVASSSAAALPPSENTTKVDYSESAVTVPACGQSPAATAELEGLMSSAIRRYDLVTVNHLLDQGVDPNIRSPLHGYTPLYRAIIGMGEDMVITLLDRGADPNIPAARVSECITPLLLAAQQGNYKAFRLLLDRGADPGARDDADHTALHMATVPNNTAATTKTLNCLLDRGICVNARDQEGRTPLLYGVLHCNIAGVNILLRGGANPNIPDNCGETPLNKAVVDRRRFKIKSMVNSLLANGANPNKPGRFGHTPLHLALQRNRPEVVDILLANGARADIPNASGLTARDIAAACGVVDVLHNYMPPYQPKTLMACTRTCIRSRLVQNQVPLAKALATGADCLPLPKLMQTYLYQPLSLPRL